MKRKLLFILMIVSLLVTSCRRYDEMEEQKGLADRTILVYMVAENSLYSYVWYDINEILAAAPGLNKNERIALYVDDLKLPRLYIIDNNTRSATLKPVFEYTKDFDSTDPQTLRRVINTMITLCPAREYGYVFWSHGSGWIPVHSQHTQTRSFGTDNQRNVSVNEGYYMDISDMASVLKDYGKSTFILFDACFMQSFETAYELRDVTRHIIGSPAEIPGDGAPYNLLLKHFFAQPFSPDSIAHAYWSKYNNPQEGIVISSIKTDELEQFARITSELVDLDSLETLNLNGMLNYFHYDQWYSNHVPDALDAYGLMKRVLSASDFEIWKSAFKKVVPTSYCTSHWFSVYGGAHYEPLDATQFGGVSMYVPRAVYKARGEKFYNEYYGTEWYKALHD